MPVELQDVLTASFVLVGVELLNDQADVERFQKELNTDIRLEVNLVANVPSGLTEPGRTIRMNRERMSLELSSARATIAREYPQNDEELAELAHVAALAIGPAKEQGREPQAYGYNIETVFEQDSGMPAVRYLGQRLFNYPRLEKDDWGFFGGTGSLIFATPDGQRTITIEPRLGDNNTSKVFLRMNLHRVVQTFPDEIDITHSLEGMQREAKAFMERLDQSEQL